LRRLCRSEGRIASWDPIRVDAQRGGRVLPAARLDEIQDRATPAEEDAGEGVAEGVRLGVADAGPFERARPEARDLLGREREESALGIGPSAQDCLESVEHLPGLLAGGLRMPVLGVLGVQAIIDLEVTSPTPWKGGIRIEVGGAGVTGKRAVIPISVA